MQKGFTLIELLITVAILGILSAIATYYFTGYIPIARDVAHKANHDNILSFVEMKRLECKTGSQMTFKDANNNNVYFNCNSSDRMDFAQKLVEHVNNHICKNDIYENAGGGVVPYCMQITGGYAEMATVIDVSPCGAVCCRKSVRIRAFTDMNINGTLESEYVYKPLDFWLHHWCPNG